MYRVHEHAVIPEDFMFTLTKEEYQALRFHFGILEIGKHSKYLPHVFTEQGVAMLSSILRGKRAAQVNIQIMRTFVKLRQFLSTHKELAEKMKDLERVVGKHDKEIKLVFEAIKQLVSKPKEEKPKRQIGFRYSK